MIDSETNVCWQSDFVLMLFNRIYFCILCLDMCEERQNINWDVFTRKYVATMTNAIYDRSFNWRRVRMEKNLGPRNNPFWNAHNKNIQIYKYSIYMPSLPNFKVYDNPKEFYDFELPGVIMYRNYFWVIHCTAPVALRDIVLQFNGFTLRIT